MVCMADTVCFLWCCKINAFFLSVQIFLTDFFCFCPLCLFAWNFVYSCRECYFHSSGGVVGISSRTWLYTLFSSASARAAREAATAGTVSSR